MNHENILRVLIAEDEPIMRRGLVHLVDVTPDTELAASCKNGEEALCAIRKLRPDVALLDIAMPGRSGLDVVRALQAAERPIVVFVTAFNRFAIDAFDVHAADYLLKPLNAGRFALALARVRERMSTRSTQAGAFDSLLDAFARREPQREYLVTKEGDGVLFVPVDEIVWCEAADNYVRLHTTGKRHLIRETMRTAERRLAPHGFVRIHRSAIVNRGCVRELQPTSNGEYRVRLEDGRWLTLSRTYREGLLPRRV